MRCVVMKHNMQKVSVVLFHTDMRMIRSTTIMETVGTVGTVDIMGDTTMDTDTGNRTIVVQDLDMEGPFTKNTMMGGMR